MRYLKIHTLEKGWYDKDEDGASGTLMKIITLGVLESDLNIGVPSEG